MHGKNLHKYICPTGWKPETECMPQHKNAEPMVSRDGHAALAVACVGWAYIILFSTIETLSSNVCYCSQSWFCAMELRDSVGVTFLSHRTVATAGHHGGAFLSQGTAAVSRNHSAILREHPAWSSVPRFSLRLTFSCSSLPRGTGIFMKILSVQIYKYKLLKKCIS